MSDKDKSTQTPNVKAKTEPGSRQGVRQRDLMVIRGTDKARFFMGKNDEWRQCIDPRDFDE